MKRNRTEGQAEKTKPEREPKQAKHHHLGSGTYVFGFVTILFLLTPIVLHSAFGIAFSPVLTGSMRPIFNPGDVLVTKNKLASDLKIGDVVVLRNAKTNELYSHRIVDISQDKVNKSNIDLQTKGDSNDSVDADAVQVSKSGEIPTGIGRIPMVGKVIVAFTNSRGKFIGYFFILLFVVLMIPPMFRRKNKSVTDSQNSVVNSSSKTELDADKVNVAKVESNQLEATTLIQVNIVENVALTSNAVLGEDEVQIQISGGASIQSITVTLKIPNKEKES